MFEPRGSSRLTPQIGERLAVQHTGLGDTHVKLSLRYAFPILSIRCIRRASRKRPHDASPLVSSNPCPAQNTPLELGTAFAIRTLSANFERETGEQNRLGFVAS